MSLVSDEEFAPIAAAAGDLDQLRAAVTLLVATKILVSEAAAVRDDADRLADCEIDPAIVYGFRRRAEVIDQEAVSFRTLRSEASGA